IRPFRAIRFAPGTDLSEVTAPAYDVVGPREQSELASRHPHNIIGVTLDRDTPGDDASSNKYTRAAARLRDWLAAGVLAEDEKERLWLYRLDYPSHGSTSTTVGVVAAVELSPFGDRIAPHERTMAGPKADRLELMRTTAANLEPLWFVAARPLGGVGALAERLEPRPPAADVTDRQGTRHRLWAIPGDDAGALVASAAGVPFVIADGHHRYETALAYRDERRAAEGPGPWDFTLGLIVDPVEHPPVLDPIHRLVDPPDAAPLLASLRAGGELDPFAGGAHELLAEVARRGPGTIGVVSGVPGEEGAWTMTSSAEPDTVTLSEILSPSGTPVRYEHDRELFLDAVAAGALGFALAPTPLAVVLEHALAGRRMPPKTTLFWPKPRSGLLLRDLGPPAA
ncbi:MAG: DUF1015 family protein, partial [Actinomycetota bacterium]